MHRTFVVGCVRAVPGAGGAGGTHSPVLGGDITGRIGHHEQSAAYGAACGGGCGEVLGRFFHG